MEFLHLIEGIRNPVLDAFFSAITYFGDELLFMVLAITVFWCFNKRDGYYILMVGFLGTVFNQFLKLWFRIPRPWVLDPDFTIVESAREAASGYSFPSGHTQNSVGTMASIALVTKKNWLRGICIALLILVPFSRLYLGVHTLLDVGVAFAMALALAFAMRPVMLWADKSAARMNAVLCITLVITLAYLAFVSFYPFPADTDAHNLHSGTKNAYTLLGCLIGLLLGKQLDDRFTRFETDAVWWAQVIKVVLGLAGIVVIKSGLKAPLQAFLPEHAATAVRYGLMVFFASAVWPLTFRFFARLGKQKEA